MLSERDTQRNFAIAEKSVITTAVLKFKNMSGPQNSNKGDLSLTEKHEDIF